MWIIATIIGFWLGYYVNKKNKRPTKHEEPWITITKK